MRKIFATLIFLFMPIYLAAEKDTLEISLSTQNALSAIYFGQIYNQGASFSSSYLQQIESVMQFDLNHNGVTKTLPKDQEKDVLLAHLDPAVGLNEKVFARSKYFFVIKAAVKKQQLQCLVFQPETGQLRSFDSIKLTGDLSLDRKQIHQLCDSLLQIYFGKLGTATKRILYTVRVPNPSHTGPKWLSEVWLCDYDGANAKQITFDNHYNVHPLFVIRDNHKKLLYVSYKNGQAKLYECPIEKAVAKIPLLSLRGNQLLPAFSLQYDKLAFISDAAGRPDLFMQKMNDDGMLVGKPIQLFTAPHATQASPSFSPDGSKLAFVSDKDGSPRIYVIQIPQGRLKKVPYAQLITKRNRQNVTPSWSSDGTKIAYSAKTGKERQIWIYDFILDEEIQLTYGPMDKENPMWAPDNIHIMYNTEDENTAEIFLIDIFEKTPVQISKGTGKKRFPSWEQ